jgi:hypothetical protein
VAQGLAQGGCAPDGTPDAHNGSETQPLVVAVLARAIVRTAQQKHTLRWVPSSSSPPRGTVDRNHAIHNNIVVSIPDVDEATGYLPPGIHEATLAELVDCFGWNSTRRELFAGLQKALSSLKHAGCRRVFVNGSFVTSKENPGDIDVCWDEDGVAGGGIFPGCR